MKLSILVTRYKEPWRVCKSLFDSIAMQQDTDFNDIEVIVCNDGDEDTLDDSVFFNYPYNVSYFVNEHKGVSATRNSALEKAIGDYVMFCDIDDMFSSVFAFHMISKYFVQKPDAIVSPFLEEQPTEDGIRYLTRSNDATFVHGKVYRREFLLENDLRFDPSLTIHEDGYFNALALACADTKATIEAPIYLWKWNGDSVVRKNPKYFTLKTYGNLIASRTALCRELQRREMIDDYINCVVKTVLDSYYDFQKPNALEKDNAKLVLLAEQAFKLFYNEFGIEYKEANINRIAGIMYLSRKNAFENGLRVESKSIREWLNHITKEI